jgi:hypothetical protein
LNEGANILSNDPQNPKTRISIAASIKPYINVEPGHQIRLQGSPGDKVSKKVTITSFEKQPFKIIGITSTIEDKISYELNTIEEGKIYSLEIKTPAGLQGPFDGKVELQTNSKKKPSLVLHVKATMSKEVRVAPQYLFFGIIDTDKAVINSESLTRKVQISKVKGNDLTIEKIEPSTDWITTKIETNEKGEQYTIIVTLNKEKLPKGKLK